MEYALTPVKIHNYLNKAKRGEGFIINPHLGNTAAVMSKKSNIPQRCYMRNVMGVKMLSNALKASKVKQILL